MDDRHDSSHATRQRLLEAAGAVFAERGFDKATVRDICKRAGANLAAVNYHFRGKEGLYSELLTYAHRCAMEKHPDDAARGAGAPAEQRLRAFIAGFIDRVFDDGRPAWHGKLMSREMAEPTAALDALVEQSIRPNFILISGIVRDLFGEAGLHSGDMAAQAFDERIRLCAASVVGQCLHYFHARAVIARLTPEQKFGTADRARLAEHIAEFSLAAIRSIAASAQRPSANGRSGRRSQTGAASKPAPAPRSTRDG